MEIKPKIGTCSWNYDSWIGLVYSEKSSSAAGYLKQYAKMYRTVEIDSWFYALPQKEKMPSPAIFINRLEGFLKQVPPNLPLAIETRNRNYLQKDYFELLRNHDVMHVFSEKLYMPHVYEVYDRYADLLTDGCVIRLLGSDRRAIEKATNQKWDTIVEPKSDLNKIAAMVNDMIGRGMTVTINVNNHYEGSAPLTIKKLGSLL